MSNPLDADTARRLAAIRLLLARAIEVAGQPAPYSSDAISRLHDVAETFLALAAGKHHAKIPAKFEDYWGVLGTALGRPLSYRAAMQRLNKVRVSLKHYGIDPAPAEIPAAIAAVEGLLTDETLAIFEVRLEDVSLASFVQSEDGAAALTAAEEHWSKGDAPTAFAHLVEAFDALIRDYQSNKKTWRGSLFDATRSLDRGFNRSYLRNADRDERRYLEAIEATIYELNDSLMMVGLGVDLARYVRFNALTPPVSHMLNGSLRFSVPKGWTRTELEFTFCRDFVVSTALLLAERDYSYEPDRSTEGNAVMIFRKPSAASAFQREDDDTSTPGS